LFQITRKLHKKLYVAYFCIFRSISAILLFFAFFCLFLDFTMIFIIEFFKKIFSSLKHFFLKITSNYDHISNQFVLINFSSYITYIIISEETIYTYTSLGDARCSENLSPKLRNPIDKEPL
jgi:hypothetical protein